MKYVRNENNDWQYFDALKRSRNKRHSSGEFFVEGVRNINECLANGWQVSAAVFSDRLSDWGAGILKRLEDTARFYKLERGLLEKLSGKQDKGEASELIFIVRARRGSLSALRPDGIGLIYDRASNKGNLGAVIRSCDAFGVDCLILAGRCVDMHDPEVLRASVGSFFKQKIVAEPSFNKIAEWVRAQNAQVLGTSEGGGLLLGEDCFARELPAIIILGNETMGMSENFRAMSGATLRIPMSGGASASSLNAACAASIILHAAYRAKKHNC